MLRIRQPPCPPARHLLASGHTPLYLTIALGLGCLSRPGMLWAATADSGAGADPDFGVAKIFTFLFLMLGPFKIIGPFLNIVEGADAMLTRRIALRAVLLASLALLLAAVLGEHFLSSYGIPIPVLALSAGIILFVVALQNTLRGFNVPARLDNAATRPAPAQALRMALSPLAFPTIVTPYGIAAVVVFLAVSRDVRTQLAIGAILLAIMLLNLTVMLGARHIGPVLGVLLQVLGAVLGVIQVALGLQIIHNSLNALGLL